jgi:hypothetical protein
MRERYFEMRCLGEGMPDGTGRGQGPYYKLSFFAVNTLFLNGPGTAAW